MPGHYENQSVNVHNTLGNGLAANLGTYDPTLQEFNLSSSGKAKQGMGQGLAASAVNLGKINPQMDMMRNRTTTMPYNMQNPVKGKGFDFDKGMGIAGGVMDGANLIMNYQQMQAQNRYNDQNMAIMQEQQGLAKRAHDVNFANQQSMQRQMV